MAIMAIVPYLQRLEPDIIFGICPPAAGEVRLAVLKRQLGGSVCVNGNVDLRMIQPSTAEQFEAEVRWAVSLAASGGGPWLGTSASFRDGSRLENGQACFQVAAKYDKYRL